MNRSFAQNDGDAIQSEICASEMRSRHSFQTLRVYCPERLVTDICADSVQEMYLMSHLVGLAAQLFDYDDFPTVV